MLRMYVCVCVCMFVRLTERMCCTVGLHVCGMKLNFSPNCQLTVTFISSNRHNSPVWLITDNETLAKAVVKHIPDLIATLPELNSRNAEAAWRDHGEVILCANREEMLQLSNEYAPEHLHVSAVDLDWWRDNLSCYGSLFLGEVTFHPCIVLYAPAPHSPLHISPHEPNAITSHHITSHHIT